MALYEQGTGAGYAWTVIRARSANILAITCKSLRHKNEKKMTRNNNQGLGRGDGGSGAVWTVTPPMNE